MIKVENLEFEYFERDEEENLTNMVNAIRGINFNAQKGDFIAIAGKNGSGKSTFAKVLNALLIPIEGTVIIGGVDEINDDAKKINEIRKNVGMVFQNPDNQIVGSIVSEDVAFGAENIGVPEDKLWNRVKDAVRDAGLGIGYLDKKINELSGGEKQKVAIAGVLAMKPRCIVLDEATSMLDPSSRYEILSVLKQLNEKENITIIMITHIMEELLWADYIYIMNKGRIVMKGRKEAIFSDEKELQKIGLDIPSIIDIKNRLNEKGIIHNPNLYSILDIVNQIKKEYHYKFQKGLTFARHEVKPRKINVSNAIVFQKASFSYGKKEVLKNVSFSIGKGEYVSIIGETGSGKSTMLQLIPGLLKCNEEAVFVDGSDVMSKYTDLNSLRLKIGFVFQYPEQQLFAKNVYEDVVFGPRNVGISEVEAEKRAYESIKLVGLSEDVYDLPLSKLSGGQKRRVALAGVLAMKPEYLILDEPLAGLDPEGKNQMEQIIDILHKDAGITIICVNHDLESVAKYSDRVIALDDGKIVAQGSPAEVFYEIYFNSRNGAKRDMEKYVDDGAKRDTEKYVDDGAKRDTEKYADDGARYPRIMELLFSLREEGLDCNCIEDDIEKGITNIEKALGL